MRDSVHEQIIVDTNMTTQSPNTPKRRTYSAEFKELLVQETPTLAMVSNYFTKMDINLKYMILIDIIIRL